VGTRPTVFRLHLSRRVRLRSWFRRRVRLVASMLRWPARLHYTRTQSNTDCHCRSVGTSSLANPKTAGNHVLQRSRASEIIGHHNVYRPGSLTPTFASKNYRVSLARDRYNSICKNTSTRKAGRDTTAKIHRLLERSLDSKIRCEQRLVDSSPSHLWRAPISVDHLLCLGYRSYLLQPKRTWWFP